MLARAWRSTPARGGWVIRRARVCPQALPFQQFHVLFNPLFKVLFIFRSLYLCAIGLWPVFSLRRGTPPILRSIPKLRDSLKGPLAGSPARRTGLSPSAASRPRELGGGLYPRRPLQITTRAPEAGAGFQIWAVAASLAVTRAIPVGFFSSAY